MLVKHSKYVLSFRFWGNQLKDQLKNTFIGEIKDLKINNNQELQLCEAITYNIVMVIQLEQQIL